jgi:hypothetical protein
LLGPDPGHISNSKSWKKITPKSQSSPFISQGDIGFLQYKNKKYGQFYVAVQTYTRKVFALPIKNKNSETLIEAIGKMIKVKQHINKTTRFAYWFCADIRL